MERESTRINDIDVFNHVLQWKQRWTGNKEEEIARTIQNLCSLGWISPIPTDQLIENENDLY